jgi:uncharacterized membrane-anchored protein YhcB (DUF1043 family)
MQCEPTAAAVNLTPVFVTAVLALLAAVIIQSLVIPVVQARTRRLERWEDNLSELSGLLEDQLPRSATRLRHDISSELTWEKAKEDPDYEPDIHQDAIQQQLSSARTSRQESRELLDQHVTRARLLLDRLRREHRRAPYWRRFHVLELNLRVSHSLFSTAGYLSDEDDPDSLWQKHEKSRKALVDYLKPLVESMKPPRRHRVRRSWRWLSTKVRRDGRPTAPASKPQDAEAETT